MNSEVDLVNEHIFGPLAVNGFGEAFLFNLNRHAFDRVSAEALFDAKFSDELFKENTLNIIVGTDSGLLPKYVNGKKMPKGSRYVFIEPEGVLQVLHENKLLEGLNDCIVCIGLSGWDEAIKNFKIADYFYINAVRSFNAICAQDDFINEYLELSWYITELLSKLHWEASVSIGQEAFIDRQLRNVADNKMPAKLLQNAFCGRTVVLLAGGPSLDDALPWVKQNRDKFVVFAVSRISRQLLAAEIEPDFVFSVDPQEISFDIGKEMLNFSPRTTFICSYHAVPTLLNQWLGPMFYLGPRLPWNSPLNVANLSGAGPTVTNTALHVAYELGFARVILAGVDLCYTKDGFTHAKGSNEYLAGPKLNLISLQIETNSGEMAPTGFDYAKAVESLGEQARLIVSARRKVINVSPGAAKIKHVEFVPLADIQLEDADIDPADVVQAKMAGHIKEERYLAKVLGELKSAELHVRTIVRLSKQAGKINDAMYNSSGFIVDYKDKKKLDQIERKFRREHRHFARLVKRFGIRRFMQVTKPFSDDDWSPEEARKLGNIYYEAYQEGASKLLGLLEGAIDRCVARQQECKQMPDFSVLFEQCRKDRSFGRVRLWKKKQLDVLAPPDTKTQFDECERQFLEVLHRKDTRHLEIIKKRGNLSFVRQRAGLLFKHKKAQELRDLLMSLDKHERQQEAGLYKYLVNGYLAELEGRPDEALNAYHLIIEAGDALLEEALLRVAGISIELDDAANTKLALQCLAQLNPVYLPLYAEIQRLHGDMMAAIDAYNSYIGQFPRDTLAQMKLARLYMECKVFDGAEMMLDYILQQKPDLEAAISMKGQIMASRSN